jgi:hypothetical protein
MSKQVFGYFPEIPEEELRSIVQLLCQDLASLNAKWHLYLDLFAEKEDVAVLNNTAMGAFQIIEESLRSDMAISIGRLCDPPELWGHQNLSLQKLAEQAKHIQGLVQLLDNFLTISKPVRDYRNKRIAHNDLKANLEPHDNPLPNITRKTIDDILKIGNEILNHILKFYKTETAIDFESTIVFGSGNKLIKWLKRAWRIYEEEQKALTKGK